MRIDAISIGANPPKEVNVIVEVPIGGEPIKYEMDKAAGTMVVDRFLYTSMRYPGNYGFIPHTLSDDGDPIDVLIVSERTLVPGAVIAVRPVGVLKMTDEAGGDEKIVAVPVSRITQRYNKIQDVADLPEILEIFDIEFISGNPENALDDPGSILLTEASAAKYFPDENPQIGRAHV